MPRRKVEVEMLTCGVYAGWDSQSKDLPKFREATRRVRADLGVEFGYVVQIRRGKNKRLQYCIDHPGILDDEGAVREPFSGEEFIKTSDWKFYLGDTIWAPIDDKLGKWRMTLQIDGQIIADETFILYED